MCCLKYHPEVQSLSSIKQDQLVQGRTNITKSVPNVVLTWLLSPWVSQHGWSHLDQSSPVFYLSYYVPVKLLSQRPGS